jgi:type III secretion HrpO family protein
VDSVADLTQLAQEALLLALTLSLPVVGVAAVMGLIVAVFQAATQVQDFTLAHLLRLVVVAVSLAVFAPYIGRQIATFTERAFLGG